MCVHFISCAHGASFDYWELFCALVCLFLPACVWSFSRVSPLFCPLRSIDGLFTVCLCFCGATLQTCNPLLTFIPCTPSFEKSGKRRARARSACIGRHTYTHRPACGDVSCHATACTLDFARMHGSHDTEGALDCPKASLHARACRATAGSASTRVTCGSIRCCIQSRCDRSTVLQVSRFGKVRQSVCDRCGYG